METCLYETDEQNGIWFGMGRNGKLGCDYLLCLSLSHVVLIDVETIEKYKLLIQLYLYTILDMLHLVCPRKANCAILSDWE